MQLVQRCRGQATVDQYKGYFQHLETTAGYHVLEFISPDYDPLMTGISVVQSLQVPDVNQVGSYTATVQQVAAPNYQLRSLTGYSLKVSQ